MIRLDMARYLVVAHQTAVSPELLDKIRALARDDPDATFVFLIPDTPPSHLLSKEEADPGEVARKRAMLAREILRKEGITVTRISMGDPFPVLAIDDELREHRLSYQAVIVSTFPAGVSQWLRLDLPAQIERRFRLPVIHVIAQPSSS